MGEWEMGGMGMGEMMVGVDGSDGEAKGWGESNGKG